ncbi:MAG: deoxyguanosinetriphosphate triphosphohydrolase [Phycisphaerae bacterium]|nr:deoxyguanosinetriphosphate triphosphohydrolase [Phycisphaerae bacterium]
MKADARHIFSRIAAKPENSRGRVHAEPHQPPTVETSAPLLDAFEVDRKRVLASAAFRRLECKTQVFVTGEHDHFRTRLTHSLDVAQVARWIAGALGVNKALAEVISLAHDLGHAPFGHAGEVTLRSLMREHGGFEHNLQSLRVVDYLEHPYPPFRGLNLSYETREGLAKHVTAYDQPDDTTADDPALMELFASGPWATIEGQIACIADRIAYNTHDLEDALGAGLLDEPRLREVELWSLAADPVRRRYPDAPLPSVRRPILDRLWDLLLMDVIAESQKRAERFEPATVDQARGTPDPIVSFSAEMSASVGLLESFLRENVYHHPRLVRMDDRARRFIERLFEAYQANPAMLPQRFARRIDQQGVHRVVCDYIAGMTDRFCQEDYKRMFEPG